MATALAFGEIEASRDFAPVCKFVEMFAIKADSLIFESVYEILYRNGDHRHTRHNEKHGRLFVQHDDAFLCCLNG